MFMSNSTLRINLHVKKKKKKPKNLTKLRQYDFEFKFKFLMDIPLLPVVYHDKCNVKSYKKSNV